MKGDILEESTCCIPNDSRRLKGERKTKQQFTTWRRTVKKEQNKAEWKKWEVAMKHFHKTESVGQTAWRPYARTGAMRYGNNDIGPDQPAE